MTAESFKQQYFSLHPKLYRIACAIIKNVEDAEDIVQDAYCKLWDDREKLAGIHKPEAYCVTLIKHLCLDFLRSPKASHNDDITGYEFSFKDETETVEETMINRETVKQIKYLMNSLPEKQRQVLHLRSFGECSLEEIEKITGESPANVRVLLSRARNTLRTKLKY
ncbi:MAG: sigma-70 family RNA polymerase sigma factor [Tannerella sp.]|nr:sigma-70 family RNA polymerase sigma factor [Tannerella sp.]